MRKILRTKNETLKFGAGLAKKLKGGDILCLYGDLGAGKTTLVKGLAKGMGIKKVITSPTFALMNIYEVKPHPRPLLIKERKTNANFVGNSLCAPSWKEGERITPAVLKLVHIDTYRLKNEQELVEIGVEDYLNAPDTICVIEWPEKIKGLLKKKKTVRVVMEHLDGNKRRITSP